MTSQDEEHLKLLSIFHYVLAGITALFACFPIFHLLFGVLLLAGGLGAGERGGPPAFFGLFLVLIPGLFILFGWTLAVCLFLSGRWLAARRHRTYCLAVAGVSCCFFPFGTVLGVFTIVVLTRPSVRALFESAGAVAPAGPPPARRPAGPADRPPG